MILNLPIETFFVFILIFLITIVFGNILYVVIRGVLEKKLSPRNSKFLARLSQYAIFIIGLYIGVYHVLHLNLKALAASLGFISIAIAFSSQQIIQNIIAGILISTKRPIWYEDWVEIGNSGIARVKDIALTQTILRSLDGRLFYMPNASLLSSNIINYSKAGVVEISVPFTVNDNVDLEKVKVIIFDVLDKTPKILPNVSKGEKSHVTKLFQMEYIKNFFDNKSSKTVLNPRVFIKDISSPKIVLNIHFWIREIHLKNEIISEFLSRLSVEIKKEVLH